MPNFEPLEVGEPFQSNIAKRRREEHYDSKAVFQRSKIADKKGLADLFASRGPADTDVDQKY